MFNSKAGGEETEARAIQGRTWDREGVELWHEACGGMKVNQKADL